MLSGAYYSATDIVRPSVERGVLFGFYGAIAGAITGCVTGAIVGLLLPNRQFRIIIGLITGIAMAWFIITREHWIPGTAWGYALSSACIAACIASAYLAGVATSFE